MDKKKQENFPAFVETVGLEPTTSCMPCKHSSQLSYAPEADANVVKCQEDIKVRIFSAALSEAPSSPNNSRRLI